MSYTVLSHVATGDVATANLQNLLIDDIAVLKTSIDNSGHLLYPIKQSKVANYSIVATDDVVLCNGTFTATLPDVTTCTGRFFNIKNTGTGTITVATVSAQTIDGASTFSLSVQYQSVTIYSDGTTWW